MNHALQMPSYTTGPSSTLQSVFREGIVYFIHSQSCIILVRNFVVANFGVIFLEPDARFSLYQKSLMILVPIGTMESQT